MDRETLEPQMLRNYLAIAASRNDAHELVTDVLEKRICMPAIARSVAAHPANREIIHDFFADFPEKDVETLRFCVSQFYGQPTLPLALETIGWSLYTTGDSGIAKKVGLGMIHYDKTSLPTFDLLVRPAFAARTSSNPDMIWKHCSEYWNLPNTRELATWYDSMLEPQDLRADVVELFSANQLQCNIASLSRLTDALLTEIEMSAKKQTDIATTEQGQEVPKNSLQKEQQSDFAVPRTYLPGMQTLLPFSSE